MAGLWSERSGDPQNNTSSSLWDPSSHESARAKDPNMLQTPRPQRDIRRLSSATAISDDFSLGPFTVAPPKDLQEPTDAHETAAALEMAKHRLSVVGDGTSTPDTPPVRTTTDTYAFAFDIDGVLIRGGRPIPEAIEAMKVLNGQNEYGVKMYDEYAPFTF